MEDGAEDRWTGDGEQGARQLAAIARFGRSFYDASRGQAPCKCGSGMAMETTSAGGPMAGYIWQAVHACRRALREGADSVIKIEVEDDLSVARVDGEILSCQQLKHSEAEQTITEASPIWWKAIDAWVRGNAPSNAKLQLVTTSTLDANSLLASCYSPTEIAPWDRLLAEMDRRAADAPNKQLAAKGVYQRWLGNKARRELLTRIEVASAQGRLEESNDLIEQDLMNEGVPPQLVSRIRESWVGAFMGRLTASLNSGGFEVTVTTIKQDLLEAHARHAQPGIYEFPSLDYTKEDIRTLRDEHHQHLIPQLEAIDRDQPETIVRALECWFLARKHRQDFMDGAPHEIIDLKNHDEDILHYCATNHEEHLPVRDADHAKEVGRCVHTSCMKRVSKLGRTDPPLHFTQGSYHELCNSLRLRWNPTYGDDI
jgi:hypothetical protein